MIESKSLKEIMEMGYNVFIECKGKGRVYSMTFEATAKRIKQEDEDYEEYMLATYGTLFHAVGDTIEETVSELLEQIKESS